MILLYVNFFFLMQETIKSKGVTPPGTGPMFKIITPKVFKSPTGGFRNSQSCDAFCLSLFTWTQPKWCELVF